MPSAVVVCFSPNGRSLCALKAQKNEAVQRETFWIGTLNGGGREQTEQGGRVQMEQGGRAQTEQGGRVQRAARLPCPMAGHCLLAEGSHSVATCSRWLLSILQRTVCQNCFCCSGSVHKPDADSLRGPAAVCTGRDMGVVAAFHDPGRASADSACTVPGLVYLPCASVAHSSFALLLCILLACELTTVNSSPRELK